MFRFGLDAAVLVVWATIAASHDASSGQVHERRLAEVWTNVASKGIEYGDVDVGSASFKNILASSTSGIIKRLCAGCATSHQTIFYKRLTPVPDNLDLLEVLKNRWSETNNKMSTDFELYSDYAAAIAGRTGDAWQYCNFIASDSQSPVGAFRDCRKDPNVSPDGSVWNAFAGRNAASGQNVAFYVDTTNVAPWKKVAGYNVSSGNLLSPSHVWMTDQYIKQNIDNAIQPDPQGAWGLNAAGWAAAGITNYNSEWSMQVDLKHFNRSKGLSYGTVQFNTDWKACAGGTGECGGGGWIRFIGAGPVVGTPTQWDLVTPSCVWNSNSCQQTYTTDVVANHIMSDAVFSMVVARLANGRLNVKLKSGFRGATEGTGVIFEAETKAAFTFDGGDKLPVTIFTQYQADTTTTTTTTTTITSTTTTSTTITSTTTTSTTTTSTTTTSTTTTTTLPAMCTRSSLVCPVPLSLDAGEYVILGSESGSGSCGSQTRNLSRDGERFFNITADCNGVETIVSAENVSMTVSLIASKPLKKDGSILFQKDFDWPTIVCTCVFDLKAGVSVSTDTSVTFEQSTNVSALSGKSSFNPTLALYASDAFDQALNESGSFPTTSGRFFLEAQTSTDTDVLGFVDCTASPTDPPTDQFTQVVLSNSCPVGPFQWTNHTANRNNKVRGSLLKFKFAGADFVFITCTVIRCNAMPCGVCQSRRLGTKSTSILQRTEESRRLAEPAQQTAKLFGFSPGKVTLFLPNALPASKLVQLFSSSGEAQDSFLVESQQQGMAYVTRANFTLYGFNAQSPTAVGDALRTALADLNIISKERLKVLRISAVWAKDGATQSNAEATLIECILMAPSLHEAEAAANRFLAIRDMSSSTLAARFGVDASDFLTIAIDLGIPTNIATLKLAPTVEVKANWASPAIVASIVVSACCICGLMVSRWIFRKHRLATKEVDTVNKAKATEEASGSSRTEPSSTWAPI